jgi:diguanylate cyclase (GGDEF)-like protein
LNGIEDFEQTLSYIVSFAEEMLKCRQISIMLYEDDLLRIRASKGIPEDVVTSTRIPVGERISDRMFQSKKAILVKTLDEIPYLANAVNVEAGSFVSMPLLLVGLTSADRPLGLINVSRKKNDPAFTDGDLEALTYIADTASIAINNQKNRIRLQSAYVETMAQAAALEYQATHDKLTGLPNRVMLKDRTQGAILAGKHEKRPFALLLMDLDRFKEINDTGHHNGDLLLQRIGQKLREVLPETCVPARLGGDEFAVFLPGAGLRDATQAAQMILDALKDPVRLEGIRLKINMSIGLSLYPEHGREADLLFHRAEAAMYMAKETRCGYRIYDPKSDQCNH